MMKKIFAFVITLSLAAALLIPGGFCVNAAADSALTDFELLFDEPVCIVDTKEITMYVNSIAVDEDDYLVLDALAINNNGDETYEVTIPRAAVNGIEIYPTYWEDVEDECDEPIEIDLSNVLENADIGDITDVELNVHIEEGFDIVYDETIHIYPYGEDRAVKYERTAADTDLVLEDNSKFTVTVIGCEYIEGWGYSVHLYIQNKLPDPIRLEGKYFKMNDTVVDTWYDDIVGGGDVCFSHVEWSQGDLDDAEITEISSVGFYLRIYDNDWDNMLCDLEVELIP